MLEKFNSWIKENLLKMSSLDGAALIVAGLAFLLFHPIAHIVAWGAVGYGVYRVITK